VAADTPAGAKPRSHVSQFNELPLGLLHNSAGNNTFDTKSTPTPNQRFSRLFFGQQRA
jgi:hypothetical protein